MMSIIFALALSLCSKDYYSTWCCCTQPDGSYCCRPMAICGSYIPGCNCE